MKNRVSECVDKFLTYGTPLSLGMGVSPIITFIFYLLSLYFDPCKYKSLAANSRKNALFIAAVLTFSFTCWIFYQPTIYKRSQEFHTILLPTSYWVSFLAWSLLSICPLLSTSKAAERINFINLSLIGCALWGMMIMGTTMLKIPPPYYGNAINPIFGFSMNTTGIAYLLSMAPIAFFMNILIRRPSENNYLFLLFLALLFAASIYFAIQIQQRTFFIIAFMVCPLILGIYGFARSINKYYLFSAIAVPIAYLLFKSFIESNFQEYRSLDLRLLEDLRFELFRNWLEQIANSPWIHPNVTFIPNKDHGPPTPWFHNFFMDAQRVSGPAGIIVALMISAYIFYLELKLLFKNLQLGFSLLIVLVSLFLILNSAVFPDAELQFFLIYLSLGMFLSMEVLSA